MTTTTVKRGAIHPDWEDWDFDDEQLYNHLMTMYWDTGIAFERDKFKKAFMKNEKINEISFECRWKNEHAMTWETFWDFFWGFYIIKANAYREKRISNFCEYCPEEFKKFKVYLSIEDHVAWCVLLQRLKVRYGELCRSIHFDMDFGDCLFFHPDSNINDFKKDYKQSKSKHLRK